MTWVWSHYGQPANDNVVGAHAHTHARTQRRNARVKTSCVIRLCVYLRWFERLNRSLTARLHDVSNRWPLRSRSKSAHVCVGSTTCSQNNFPNIFPIAQMRIALRRCIDADEILVCPCACHDSFILSHYDKMGSANGWQKHANKTWAESRLLRCCACSMGVRALERVSVRAFRRHFLALESESRECVSEHDYIMQWIEFMQFFFVFGRLGRHLKFCLRPNMKS